MINESFFNNCRGQYEQRLELAREARAVDANEAAEILETEAAEMKPCLDAFPTLDRAHREAHQARDAADARVSELAAAFNNGDASVTWAHLEKARHELRAANLRLAHASDAARVSLNQGVVLTAQALDRVLDRAKSNIENVVGACLTGYGYEGRAANSDLDDAEAARFEPIYAARAVADYKRLAGRPEHRRAKSIDVLRETLKYREERRAERAPKPSNEIISNDARSERAPEAVVP